MQPHYHQAIRKNICSTGTSKIRYVLTKVMFDNDTFWTRCVKHIVTNSGYQYGTWIWDTLPQKDHKNVILSNLRET